MKPTVWRAALRRVIQLAADRAGQWGVPIVGSLPSVIRLQTDLLELAAPSIRDEASLLLNPVPSELKQDMVIRAAVSGLATLSGNQGGDMDAAITNGWLAAASGPARPYLFAFTAFLLSGTSCMGKKDKLRERKFDEDTREDVSGILAALTSMTPAAISADRRRPFGCFCASSGTSPSPFSPALCGPRWLC